MLTTLTTLAGSLGLAQQPEEVTLPPALSAAQVEVTLQATTNHFAAENGSIVDQVLLLAIEGEEPRAVRLAPGARVLYAFPRQVARNLSIEVVALDETGWRNTGAFELEDLRASRTGALWVQAGADRSALWIEDGPEGVRHLTPTDGLVPDAWRAFHPELTDHRLSVHVPVPLPTEGKKGGKPPVIEDKKLPPV